MKKKKFLYLLFFGFLCLILTILACDKLSQRVVNSSAQDNQKRMLPFNIDHQVFPESTKTVEPADSVKPPVLAQVTISWSSMTQTERNMAILYRADRDNGRFVNLNCKEWVRRVVLDASGGLVYLPQTLPNESGWYFASSRYLVGMCGGIRSVNQGWIVQMNWRRNDGVIVPHTLIIAGRSSSGIYVIECNWCMNNCMTVAYRWISFTDFEARAVRYSCYYVTGG